MSSNKDICEMALAMSKRYMEITTETFKKNCEQAMKPDSDLTSVILCKELCGSLERARKDYQIHLTYRYPC